MEQPIYIKSKSKILGIVALVQFLLVTLGFICVGLRIGELHYFFRDLFFHLAFIISGFIIPFVISTFFGLKILESEKPKRIFWILPLLTIVFTVLFSSLFWSTLIGISLLVQKIS